MHPVQRELYRVVTPTPKLATVGRINAALRQLKVAQVQAQHAELSETERTRIVRRWWLGAHD